MTKDEGAGSGKRYEDKTKDDNLEKESYREVTRPLRRLLNKYEEDKNRCQTLRRMMDSWTYLIKGAGWNKKVNDEGAAFQVEADDAEVLSVVVP